MRTALIHDWLVGIGGGERVLEALCELYPGPIYTLIKDMQSLKGTVFEGRDIRSSFIEQLPFAKSDFRPYLPLFPTAIERFDLSDYPLIISSSHAVAKGIRKRPDQLHICYCHTPMRYAWDLKEQYLASIGFFSRLLARPLLTYMRRWDRLTEFRVNFFIANSRFVAERIKRSYGRVPAVIYPPVATDLFQISLEREDYYFTCSRLVPYKRVDLIVRAFAAMPNRRLIVVGDGPEMKKIRDIATPNVELLGFRPDEEVRTLMARSRAFIFAAEEDFGIAPVEAQASGVPVIAYGRGGALETITPETGLFFEEQTPASLSLAIARFEKLNFNSQTIKAHAERFSKKRFQTEFQQIVAEVSTQFFTPT